MKIPEKYLKKIKSSLIVLLVLALVFLMGIVMSDYKNNGQSEVVTFIGVAEEKFLKDVQFSLDYTSYGTTEEEVNKKIEDKLNEIKNSIENSDQVLAKDIEKKVITECIVNAKNYYQVKALDEGKCLSNSWRGQVRFKLTIKGDNYSEEYKNKILTLAPSIVNSISGPVYLKKELDEDYENILMNKAIENARQKAEKSAKEIDREIKKVINIDEDPIINNGLISNQSDDKTTNNQGEVMIKKEIKVSFELK